MFLILILLVWFIFRLKCWKLSLKKKRRNVNCIIHDFKRQLRCLWTYQLWFAFVAREHLFIMYTQVAWFPYFPVSVFLSSPLPFYLRHQRSMEVMFSPLSVSVCLAVCEQDISKSCGRIRMKFGGQFGYVTRTHWFDFGEGPDLYPATWNFKMILHHWEMGLETIRSPTSQKVMCRFGRNLVDRSGVWWGRSDLILINIRIRRPEFFLILRWFFTIERLGQKRYEARYFKKLLTDSDETTWMSWLGDENKPIRFWFR